MVALIKKYFAALAVLGLLFGCATFDEAEDEETTLAPGPGNARQGMFDQQQMQRSLMESRQRSRSIGR